MVKYTKDYADEFDCEGFGVYPKKDWDKTCKKTEIAFEDCHNVEVPFGTNEGLTFSSYDDWFDSLEVIEIEEEDAKKLIKLFGESFGTASSMLDVATYIESDEEEDDDE